MRLYAPLKADHPLVAGHPRACPHCRVMFRPGDVTTLKPIDPRATGTVECDVWHARCAGASDADIYLEAYRTALICFAWWKDGTQYVGTSGMTLAKALREIGAEE